MLSLSSAELVRGHERGRSCGNNTIGRPGKRLNARVEVIVHCNLPETGVNTGQSTYIMIVCLGNIRQYSPINHRPPSHLSSPSSVIPISKHAPKQVCLDDPSLYSTTIHTDRRCKQTGPATACSPYSPPRAQNLLCSMLPSLTRAPKTKHQILNRDAR